MAEVPAGVLWGGRLGGAAIVLVALGLGLTLIAGPGHRLGLISLRPALLLQAGAMVSLLIGPLLAIAGLALTRGAAGGAPAVPTWAALVAGLVFSANGAIWVTRASRAPPIHDITTDPDRPPSFVAIRRLRASAPNPAAYAGPAVAEQQRAAYPDLEPIVVEAPPDEAYRAARDLVSDLGWSLVAASAGEGRVEATDTTFWFGFKDDVVIRIRPEGTGARIDVRSKSRVGRSDLGKNAERIREFRAALLAKLRG